MTANTILTKIPKIVYYILGMGLFAVAFTRLIMPYTAPFVIGTGLAAMIDPAVSYIQEKLRINRTIAVFFVLIALFSIIVIAGVTVLLHAWNELQTLTTSGYGFSLLEVKQFESWVQSYQKLQEHIPPNLFRVIEDSVKDVNQFIADTGQNLLSIVVNLVKDIPRILIYTIVTFLATFFMSKDKERIQTSLLGLFPSEAHQRLLRVRNGILSGAMGYIRAQLIIVTITATIATTGFLILQAPYVWFLAILIFILDFIPAIGPSLVFLPWAVWSFTNGDYSLAIGFLITYALIFTVRQILEPKLVGDRIGVHPLLALFSLFVGVRLFGVFGFVIGPLVVITTKAILFTADEIQTANN